MFRVLSNYREFTDNSFINFCSEFINDKSIILEIGPGDGKIAQQLIEKRPNLDYRFIDINDRRIYQKDKELKIVDISKQSLDCHNSSIDFIICSQVIEHLHNPSNFFLQAYKALSDRGILLVKMPNFGSFFQKIKFFKDSRPFRLNGTIDDGGHINFFTHQYLLHFLKDYYQLFKIEGDQFVDMLFSRALFKFFKKDLYLVNDSIKSTFFSYNIMLALVKLKNK